MTEQKKEFALGRGLSSLIPSKHETPGAPGEKVIDIPVGDITPNPHQPRTEFVDGEINDLVESIREHGILQPLIVTEGKGGYQLIAGERRLRAAKRLGLKKVPAIVRRASEQQKLELAIVENVQRQDLNPIERAFGFKKLIDEFQLRQEDVAKKVGQKRSSVANTLRLLTLPDDIIEYLSQGRITEGHAKVLLSLDSDDLRRQMLKKILLHNLSVRETEAAIGGSKKKKPARRDEEIAKLEDRLQKALATKVSISGKRSFGRIVIEYYSEDELHDLMGKLT
jgi:ParB family chromosome partitioning protein